jgi:DNA adenine methylase
MEILKKTDVQAKPFLKWVGGKRSILQELISRLPESYGSYHELFMGGGALYFATRNKSSYLSDVNERLVNAFMCVRDNADAVVQELKLHEIAHNKDHFYEARKQLSTESDSVKKAALFIYINKTCFNGMYRVNSKGDYNVPMGRYTNPIILDETNLRLVSAVLQDVDIRHQGYEKSSIIKNDFYYLDPPYHQTFTGYDSSGFGETEQKKLAEFCSSINEKGGYFMLSNSDTSFIRDLYKKFKIETVMASRMVSCKGSSRGRKNEVVVRNY